MNVHSLLNSDEEDHSRRPRKSNDQPSRKNRRSSQNKLGPPTTSYSSRPISSEESFSRPSKAAIQFPTSKSGSYRVNKKSSSSKMGKSTKRQKAGKQIQKRDIFAWVLRKPVMTVRYYPQGSDDLSVESEVSKFQLELQDDLTTYAVNIPYNGTKKDLISKIGRESLEVFHYKYTFAGENGDNEKWDVVWDYNNGLVRMTPFFKCLCYNKTVPSKVIDANPGLREISHNVTGGNIGAQGYWVPYKAAKALAARFCWSIRYALIPLFGDDFVHLCVRPDHEDFENWKIPARILDSCAAQLRVYKDAVSKTKEDTERDFLTKWKFGDEDDNGLLFSGELTSIPCQSPSTAIVPTVMHCSEYENNFQPSEAPRQAGEMSFHRTKPVIFKANVPPTRVLPKPITNKISAEDARTALTMLQIRYLSPMDTSTWQNIKERTWQ